jgi:peptide/nickel transport system substrate-binding protein
LTTLDSTSIKSGAPNVLVVTTKVPDPILLKRLALVSVVPKAVIERVGDDQFGQKPVGSGPYKVVSFKPEDTLELVANPEHPFRPPTIQQVTVKNIREASAREAGLRTGDVDFVDYLGIDQAERLRAAGFALNVITSGQSQGYWMDTVVGDRPTSHPTVDKRVRQAINYAIDKEAINRSIYKGFSSVEQGQPIQPQTFGFNPRLKPYPYDPAKAKQLLAEAGYPSGSIKIKLEFFKSTPEQEQVALFVQQQLRDVGIELEVSPLADYANFRDKFYGVQERPALFLPGLLNSPAMDADFALVWFSGTQPGGTRHFNNPEFDRYYLASTTELNEQKRLELLQKALEVLHEEAPYLFLVTSVRMQAYKKNLQGIEPRTDYEPELSKLRWS